MKHNPKTLLFDIFSHVMKIQPHYPVFLSISGHVNWVEVKVVASKTDYGTVLYDSNKSMTQCGIYLDDVDGLLAIKRDLSDFRIKHGI